MLQRILACLRPKETWKWTTQKLVGLCTPIQPKKSRKLVNLYTSTLRKTQADSELNLRSIKTTLLKPRKSSRRQPLNPCLEYATTWLTTGQVIGSSQPTAALVNDASRTLKKAFSSSLVRWSKSTIHMHMHKSINLPITTQKLSAMNKMDILQATTLTTKLVTCLEDTLT